MKQIHRLLAAVVLGVSLVATVPVAQGQVQISIGDQVGERGIFTSKGFDGYCRILGLDASQKEVARQLMDGTTAANRSASDEMRVAMKAFGEKMQAAIKKDGWPAAQKLLGDEMPAITLKYVQKRADLEKQFFEDLRGMLTDAQAEKMPSVERYRRRETELRSARSAGTAADLIEVLEGLRIEVGTGELADEVGRYEKRLDQLLIERQRLEKESEDQLKGAIKKMDLETIEKAQQPLKDNRNAIRDVTRQASAKIAALVPEDRRDAFELEVKRQEFPRVYRTPYIVKAIEAAQKLTDLDDSQRQALAQLREKYDHDCEPLNRAWVQAIEALGDGGNVRMVVNDSGMIGDDPEKGVKEAKKARTALDDSIEKQLLGILKEEQKARLPSKRAEKAGDGPDDAETMGISVRLEATDVVDSPVEVQGKPK